VIYHYHVESHLLYQRQHLRRLGCPRVDARSRDGVVGVGNYVEVLAVGVQFPRPTEPRVNREELAVVGGMGGELGSEEAVVVVYDP
jgi:hypothetical protein